MTICKNTDKTQKRGKSQLQTNFFFQHLYPKSQIDVYVTILEDDGCTLAAALTVSGLALADAAIQMFDNLVGASVVRISIIQYRR